MKGIIVTGHGNFATGLLSAMELIAGAQDGVLAIDFTIDHSTESLKDAIKGKMDSLNTDEIVILADLAGGSPFNVSVMLKNEYRDKNIEVFAGTNLGMLLETALVKDMISMDEIIETAMNSGATAIKRFVIKEVAASEDNEDGI